MNKTVRDAIRRVFKDEAPESFDLMGVEHYDPRDLGRALGYGDDGRDIVPWLTEQAAAGEIAEGEHLVRLGRRPGSPLVLTERGLFRVLMLCPKPKAAAFRDWLDAESVQDSPHQRKTALHDVSLPMFADDCLKLEEDTHTPTGDVFTAYRAWCGARGMEPVTQVVLGRWLAAHGWRQASSHRGGRLWENMRLRTC